MTTATPSTTAWSRARALADQTPEARNRYVDFLRAASISVVVIGHWLMAAPFVDEGNLRLGDMLHLAPWTQWLTWTFQVMPLFFIVGGYANAASWDAAQRSGESYGEWMGARLRRLVGPVVPLLIVWSMLALAARRLDVDPRVVKLGSQAALIPTWFLAVYVMVVVAAPATYRLWQQFGIGSFWGLALGAVVVDAVAFLWNVPFVRWINYGFVWLGVHQLGYLWREGRLAGAARALPWAAGGLALLVCLVVFASYPVSMITVPGEEVSNSRPPTLALLALAALHVGLVLAAEQPARRWLRRSRPWTATVLVNGTIMTLFLWHLTVMALIIGLANLLGGIGLGLPPATGLWWLSRPIWILILFSVLVPFLAGFGRFEQAARAKTASAPPAWRSVGGAAALSYSLRA